MSHILVLTTIHFSIGILTVVTSSHLKSERETSQWGTWGQRGRNRVGQMLSIVQAVVMCYIVNLGTGKLLKVGGGVQIRRKGGIPALDSLLRNGDGMVLGQAQEGKKRVEGERASKTDAGTINAYYSQGRQ